MSDVLATLYVDVIARGASRAAADVQALAGRVGQTARQVDGLTKVSAESGGATAGLGRAAGVAGAALGAVAGVVGLVKAGLGGTVEGFRLGEVFTQVAREAAGVFLPVVTAVTAVMGDLLGAFRAAGLGAQDFVYLSGPAGMILKVLSNPEVVGAVRRVVQAVGELGKAMAPVLELIGRVAGFFLKAFVVTPILVFAKALESVVKILSAVIEAAVRVANAFGRGLGLGDVFKVGPNAPARRQVTLNQTGTESAEGTFARIQEAALKAGTQDPMAAEQLRVLQHLGEVADKVAGWIDQLGKAAERVAPENVAAGAKQGALAGAGGGLPGMLFGGLIGAGGRIFGGR